MLKSKFKLNNIKAPIINLLLAMGVIFLCPDKSIGQEKNSTQLLDSLLAVGKDLTKEGEFQKSDSALDAARKIALENKNWSKWFVSLSRSLKNKTTTKQVEKATETLKASLKVLPKDEVYLHGKLNFNIGLNYQNLGRAEIGIFYLKEANRIFDDLLKSNFIDRLFNNYYIQTKDNLATNYARIGDYISALKFSSEGLIHSQSVKDTFRIRNLSLARGKYFYHNNQDAEAINQYLYCLSIGLGKDDIHPYLAEVYLSKNDLTLVKKYLLDDKPINLTKDYFIFLSQYYKQIGNEELAIQNYLKGLELLKANPYYPFRVIVKNTIEYAQMLDEYDQITEAVKIAHSVLKDVYPNVDSLDLYSRAPFTQSFPDIWVIEALYLKAKYFKKQFAEDNNTIDLVESKYYYDLLLSHLDKLKQNFNAINSQYKIGSYSQKIYAEEIDFYSNRYTKSNDLTHFENALRLAQSANSYVLKNAVEIRKALEVSNVPSDSIDMYLSLATNASNDEDLAPGEENPITIFDEFNSELIRNHPSFEKYQQENSLSLHQIQNELDDKSILLKYFAFENSLFQFAISKKDVFVDQIELDSNFFILLMANEEFSTNAQSWNNASYRQNSKKIYDILLKDVLSQSKFIGYDHLYIVPDGPLKNLSFSALVSSDNIGPLSAEDYLINDFSISYLYYCSQLIQEHKNYNLKGQFIGFGLEYEDDFLKEIIADYKSTEDTSWEKDRPFTLNKLEFADEEIREIAKIFNGESIVNEEATLGAVMNKINDYSILHFSAHSIVDMNDYLKSSILFNKNLNGKYQLEYQDILNLNLNSDLVVLSACQTGLGKSISGEGLVSLSQAFIQSGCKSAIGAYWKVPDESTNKVMSLFYTNLKDGMEKSRALQKAQLEYINNEELSTPRTRTPLFWASWSIYGQDIPISNTSSFPNYLYFIFVIVVFLLVIFATRIFIRRNKIAQI